MDANLFRYNITDLFQNWEIYSTDCQHNMNTWISKIEPDFIMPCLHLFPVIR